jgi:hypothetical protein
LSLFSVQIPALNGGGFGFAQQLVARRDSVIASERSSATEPRISSPTTRLISELSPASKKFITRGGESSSGGSPRAERNAVIAEKSSVATADTRSGFILEVCIVFGREKESPLHLHSQQRP